MAFYFDKNFILMEEILRLQKSIDLIYYYLGIHIERLNDDLIIQ